MVEFKKPPSPAREPLDLTSGLTEAGWTGSPFEFVAFVSGIALCLWGLWWCLRELRFALRGARAEGHVIDFVRNLQGLRRPVIAWRDPTGRARIFTSHFSALLMRRGARVRLTYDPDYPKRAEWAIWLPLRLVIVALPFYLGLLCIGVGLGIRIL